MKQKGGFRISIFFLLLARTFAQGQSPIAHYSFDNGLANDLSDYQNHGTIVGGVQMAADRYNNPCGALFFNGVNGYIEVPNSPSLSSPGNAFTVSCWFKMQKTTYSDDKWLTLICKGDVLGESTLNPQYRAQVFQSANQSTISINTEFTEYDYRFNDHLFLTDEWHFYALVYNGQSVKTYYDNVEIWEFPYRNTLVKNNAPLHIAKDIPGAIEYFGGCLDDLRIYNTALNQQQISKIYKDETYAAFDNDFNFICPNNIKVQTDKGKCVATVDYDPPEVKVNCGSGKVVQISGIAAGDEFPVGTTTQVFEATSNQGVKKSCYSKVTVVDKEMPVFKAVNDTIIYMDEGAVKGKSYSFSLPMAFDNCGLSVKQKNGPTSGSLFLPGKNVLSFVATDNAGNQTEISYIVYVLERNKPKSKNCPYDIVKVNDAGICGALVNFDATDPSTGLNSVLLEGKVSGSEFMVGESTIKLDRNPECEFKITVKDTEIPKIRCPKDTIIYMDSPDGGTVVNFDFPTAKDNCKVDSLYQTEGIPSGSLFSIGKTVNSFKAVDASGNPAFCSFVVEVRSSLNKVDPPQPKIVVKEGLPDSVRYYKTAIQFKKCILTVVLYDDSKQDMDTVSVYFNGQEIIEKELIKIKKNGTLNKALVLEPGKNNYFIFKAWNEGQISPNTLRVEFYEGYYLDNLNKLTRKKPVKSITMHAKVGIASAISLRCKN